MQTLSSFRLLLLALLLPGAYQALAQTTPGVGIGTTAPDVSAALDIVSSDKGALLPRVADATAIATPATGLLVFQTGGIPGFYYNAGNATTPSWQQLATATGAAVTASNGLTKVGPDIRLGGTLAGATTIAQAGHNFNLSGAGSVGLGTTAPAARLHVSGSLRADLAQGRFTLNNFGVGDNKIALLGTFTGNTNVAPQLRFEGIRSTYMDIGQDSSGAFVIEGNDTRRLTVQRLGNVGIGTITPTQRLDVAGNTNVSGDSYVGGRMGIGNAAPTQKLDVTGTAVVSGRVGIGNTAPAQALDVTGTAVVSGKVGVGTTAPSQTLDVTGSLRVQNPTGSFVFTNFTYSPAPPTALLGIFTGNNGSGAQVRFAGALASANYIDMGQDAGGNYSIQTNDVSRLTILGRDNATGEGNIGIGTSAPTQKLDVRGNTTVTGSSYVSGSVGIGTTAPAQKLDVAGNALVSGRLSIGTTTIGSNLNVVGNAEVSNARGKFQVHQFTPSASNTILMGTFMGLDNLGPQLRFTGGGSSGITNYIDMGQDAGGNYVIQTNDAPRLTILGRDNATGEGNVGIGTASPTARLDVNGSTRLRGLTTAGLVVTDASGNLSSSTSLPAGVTGDNLGNHLATQNLDLADKLLVGNGGSTGLAISSAGRVGLGTATPAARLDLQGGADANGAADPVALAFSYRAGGYRHFLRSRHNGGPGGNALDFYLNDGPTAGASSAPGTGNVQVLTLDNNGGPRVGIGTAAPGATLHVAGPTSTVRLEGLAGTGTRVVTADAAGTLGTATAPTNGLNAVTKTTAEAAGANCAAGGVKLEAGQDTNSNGTLDAGEVNAALTRYICNGAAGAPGASGTPGAYGDGSAGPLTVGSGQTVDWTSTSGVPTLNFQYTSINISGTLIVPSGTVLRCTGDATISGTITVAAGAVSIIGVATLGLATGAAANPYGGTGLAAVTAASLPVHGPLGGGSGWRNSSSPGGDGGGSFALLAQGLLRVPAGGTINDSGTNGVNPNTAGSGIPGAGGGAGGVITLLGKGGMTIGGNVRANGGNGAGGFDGNGGSAEGGGGGGGGGIVRLLAASAPAVTGSLAVNGGAAGATAGAVGTTLAGGGGGACGGNGGTGGATGSPATAGSAGRVLTIVVAAPENLLN